MAKGREYSQGRAFLARLSHRGDLLEEITSFCIQNGVEAASIFAIGAVTKATIGYYDQKERTYKSAQFLQPLEIVHLAGNLSLKDKKPMVHCHAVLAKENGETLGGHLMSPTEVFAGEAFITELRGKPLERTYDHETGLTLWGDLRD